MQRVLTFFLTMLFGTAVAAGIAFLVYLMFPRIAVLVFIVLTVYWLWTGWRYAVRRARIEEDRRDPFAQIIQQRLAARMNETAESLATALERAEPARERPKTILLCVNDEDTTETLTILLEHWGYKVRKASGLGAAMVEIKHCTLDLLVLDVCHPEIEINIRDLMELPYPALVIGCSEEDHNIAMPSGFKNFMTKPVEIEAFRNKVQEVLGENRSQGAAQ